MGLNGSWGRVLAVLAVVLLLFGLSVAAGAVDERGTEAVRIAVLDDGGDIVDGACYDSGTGVMVVKDSGRIPGSHIDITDAGVTVEDAIYQIRYVLIFFVFGVIPLMISGWLIYLFCRWVYRLIVGAV